MELKNLKDLFLLRSETEKLEFETKKIKKELEEKILNYLKKKIKEKDFNILCLHFEIDEDKDVDLCSFKFLIDNFQIEGSRFGTTVYYKEKKIYMFDDESELYKTVAKLCEEIYKKYKIKSFEFNGNINEIYKKVEKINKKEKIQKELSELFK